MDPKAALLEELQQLLIRQEEGLDHLIALAREEHGALVHSDFPAMERVNGGMLAVSGAMDTLDDLREALVTRLDAGSTLKEIQPLADDLGMTSLAEARNRLLARANELRTLQERNAALVLEALRLRSRWYAMLAGMAAPTYGSGGEQQLEPGRNFVSRSA